MRLTTPPEHRTTKPVTLLSYAPGHGRAFARDADGQVWLLSDESAEAVDDAEALNRTPPDSVVVHRSFPDWELLAEHLAKA